MSAPLPLGATFKVGAYYCILQTIVPGMYTFRARGTILCKKIKLSKVGFLIASKNVLIEHIEKMSKNVDTPSFILSAFHFDVLIPMTTSLQRELLFL